MRLSMMKACLKSRLLSEQSDFPRTNENKKREKEEKTKKKNKCLERSAPLASRINYNKFPLLRTKQQFCLATSPHFTSPHYTSLYC